MALYIVCMLQHISHVPRCFQGIGNRAEDAVGLHEELARIGKKPKAAPKAEARAEQKALKAEAKAKAKALKQQQKEWEKRIKKEDQEQLKAKNLLAKKQTKKDTKNKSSGGTVYGNAKQAFAAKCLDLQYCPKQSLYINLTNANSFLAPLFIHSCCFSDC